MENKTLKFKTNLNCGNCVSKVQADLDKSEEIIKWEVDTNHPDKILTVESKGASEEDIILILRKKGFKAEAL